MGRRHTLTAGSLLVTLAICAAMAITRETAAQQAVVVTSTADAGPGSLRSAMESATPGTLITFDPSIFPPDAPATILLTTPLPFLDQGNVTIDASDAGVILDGSNISRDNLRPGLTIVSNGNIIRGLQVLRFPADGISLQNGAQENVIGGDRAVGAGPTGQGNVISLNGSVGLTIADPGTGKNLVTGNNIGTDSTGAVAWGNGIHGIMIARSSDNTIGGASIGEANLISANQLSNVRIVYSESTGNVLIGNHIGTDATGTTALGGGPPGGVAIELGASENRIGGLGEGERNIISGHGEKTDGVCIDGSGTEDNLVLGNYIGVDITGSNPLPNSHGVSLLQGASHNTVQGNVISGHEHNPNVIMWDAGTSFNVIIGNLIGTDATGTVAIASAGGVGIRGGASDNRIGGSAPGEGNLISGNGDGVDISFDSTRNQVLGNLIGTDLSGTTAIPNDNGIRIKDAPGNTIGSTAEGEGNTISGNEASGIEVTGSGSVGNQILGNIIGLNVNAAEPLGNRNHGVFILEGAASNIIGPGNVIAHNGQGITITGKSSIENLVTQNSIFSNDVLGIENVDDANRALPAPTITEIGSRLVQGTADAGAAVEIFSDEAAQGRIYEGSAVADALGSFTFQMPVGRFTGLNVTATAADEAGNTSPFSDPASPPAPVVTRELPGLLAPTQVSLEPKVVATNLGLTLFSLLFFGFTSTVFNSILIDFRDDLIRALKRPIPASFADRFGRIGRRLRRLGAKRRGRLLPFWLVVLLGTSIIESFLDPDVAIWSLERMGVVLTIFLSALVVSGLELGADLFSRRRWAPSKRLESRIQWVGIVIAVACVILSRAMAFKPGYLYGIVGAVYFLPKLSDTINSGKRALLVMLAVFVGGLILWTATLFLPRSLTELEPIFLTIFLISLQGVFFKLIPLSVTEGGDVWSWRKGAWLTLFGIVFFFFVHFVLNPHSSDVQALQQNGIQTLVILIAVFGLATIILWLLFPFRLRRKRKAAA